jgi:hypothetical protein
MLAARRWGWYLSLAVFGAILVVLLIAALVLDPLVASLS